MSVRTISAHRLSTPKAILAPVSKSAHNRRNKRVALIGKDIYNWLLILSKGVMAEFKSSCLAESVVEL